MTWNPRLFAGVALLYGCFLASATAQEAAPTVKQRPASQEAADEAPFLRLATKDGKPTALETAVASYRGPNGVQVDLIGAVHIGEGSYYQALNDLFATYEVVLYELVAPEGTRVPKGGAPNASAIGGLQRGMKSMLGLEFQLDKVDYTKRNLVHADMSPEEFAESMADRGESFMQMFFRMMGQSAALQAQGDNQVNSMTLWAALLRQDKTQLKLAMAKQFQDMDGVMSALNGEEGSTIITERNRKAFEVLEREIAAGKKKIAVFYGAGHLPDMDKRLREGFQMRRTTTRWLPAWKLTN